MTDTDKSIEELENDHWGEAAFGSYVVRTCHQARQKPIRCLSDEEIRCLIGQKIGLRFLLPIAVDLLRNDPLIAVTYFEGDLLLALLRLDIGDWTDHPDALRRFLTILRDNRAEIGACGEIPDALTEKYLSL